jgi:hypothetical protein
VGPQDGRDDPTVRWVRAFEAELGPGDAARQARFMVHDHLVSEVSGPFLSDVLLATSELVTNAERYAPGPIRVCMEREPASHRIRVVVSDTNPQLPRRDLDGEVLDPAAGRGLRIVDMISSRWGVARTSSGKDVWFETAPGHHS